MPPKIKEDKIVYGPGSNHLRDHRPAAFIYPLQIFLHHVRLVCPSFIFTLSVSCIVKWTCSSERLGNQTLAAPCSCHLLVAHARFTRALLSKYTRPLAASDRLFLVPSEHLRDVSVAFVQS